MKQSKQLALITGASSGIGAALCEEFARDGIDLVISARNMAALEARAAELRQRHGIEVTVISADLAAVGGADALADEVAGRKLRLDYLVNNAGYGHFGLFQDSPLDKDVGMLRLNIEALTVLSKRFLPDLVKRQGKILNVASTAAFQPGPYMAVYYATKAYVLSFSEALAAELEGRGVTVTALCPGPTESGFVAAADMESSGLFKRMKVPSSASVAAAGYRAMQRGQRVFIPGALNWAMAQSVRFTPRRVVTSMVKMITGPVAK